MRRQVAALANGQAGLRTGEAELVATELGTNLLKHASPGGYVLYRRLSEGVELLSVDTGPGMAPDGRPDAESPMGLGNVGLSAGLASIKRMASVYDCYSAPTGTVVLARLGSTGHPETGVWRYGGINVPLGDDGPSGDSWAVKADGCAAALLVDGLGHGEEAAVAARAAVSAFTQRAVVEPAEFLVRAHEVMRGTRGGVIGVCTIDPDAGRLTFAGIGNINGHVVSSEGKQYLAGTPGTVGTQLYPPKFRVQHYPWPKGSTLVMVSDGVRSHWTSSEYPGLFGHEPAVIAAVLHRDFTRLTDDATVVVVQNVP